VGKWINEMKKEKVTKMSKNSLKENIGEIRTMAIYIQKNVCLLNFINI